MRRTAPASPAPIGHAAVVDALATGTFRVLTTDVFDTLVWRPTTEPRHLWPAFGQELTARGLLRVGITPDEFAIGRVRAEARARVRTGITDRAPEVTIEQIWAEMPDSWLGAERSALVDAELAFEASRLRPHRATVDLLDAAAARGARVALVSDTYLSATQLRAVLGRVGVPLDAVRDVVVSSEHGRSKADGLLDLAIQRLGVPAAQVLHIGDHPISDVVAAQRAGAACVQLSLPAEADAMATTHRPFDKYSQDHAADGGRSGSLRDVWNAAGDAALDPSFQFGAAAAGPLVAGFAAWASATAVSLGAPAVHCLLREGGTIAEAIRTVAPDGPTAVELHASRWAVLRAAVFEGTPDELFAALARRADLVPQHVVDAFGVDEALVRRVMGDGPFDHRTRAQALDRIAADDTLRSAIVAASAALRVNVQRYLRTRLQPGDGPIVLCDVGWSGMIQHGLTGIIRDMGDEREVVGLYCATTVNAEERVSRGALMRWYLPSTGLHGRAARATGTVVRYPELLERILTPDIGTLLSFTDEGEPVCKDVTEHRSPSLIAAQHGLAAAVAELAPSIAADRARWTDDLDFRVTLAEAMATVLQRPDARVARPLLEWEHDDVAGTAAEGLGASWFDDLLPYANAVDIGDVPPTEVFWLPGMAAARGGSLATQLDAIELGADPDALCPPSALGTATVTVLPRGSLRAASMWSGTPRTNQEGWSTVTHRCTAPSARAVVLQVGAGGGVVEFGFLRIEVDQDGAHHELRIDRADHDAVTAILGRRLGVFTVGFAAGGHLRIELPSGIGDGPSVVRISAAYRGIGAGSADPSLVGPPAWRRVPRQWAARAKEWLRVPARHTANALASLRARVRR
ncbi:MAG: HAD family hydrolase [Ilumatobacteraceae bacterium]